MFKQSLQYELQACAITDCADTFDSERARSRSLGEETSMKANSEKTKQSKKATRRVLAGVLCGASVLSLVLSLVMPPISQAIANDDQAAPTEETVMGGGSSSESTGVENANNGDTENQNSDETEGDEPGDDAQLEGQSEEEQQNEGTTTSDGETVAAVAENEQTGAAAGEITNKDELCSKLQGVQAGESASFKLMQNIEYNGEINLNKSGSNITLDLNGCKIKHSGENQNRPLFNVSNGAEFTIKDDSNQDAEKVTPGQKLDDQGQKFTSDYYGKNAMVNYDIDSIPTLLTYYVTKSSANDTGTTETLETHEANIKGAIVSTASKGSTLKLINVYEGGKFNLQGGTLTQKEGCGVGNLIYAENGSTVNMSGGYICGASGSSIGAGIMVSNDKGVASTLSLNGGVIAGNSAYSGGGVYARYSEVTITNGIISGNSTLNQGLGGGIMAAGGIVTVSGGYITNNRMAKFCGEDGNGCHGGAGLAANSGAHVTISGGQITGNYSDEAGGGVYVTNIGQGGMAWLDIKGGNIASNVSYRSEGAGIRVGQRVDAMINGTPDSKVYITNNHCMSRFDWGGGGIFVQGCNETPSDAGRLFVYSSYISSNTAGGYGGGVAVCPTGKTLVTSTEGTAIFGNTDAEDASSYNNENDKYDPSNNSGNNNSPHLSGGGNGKTEDVEAYKSADSNGEHVFRTSGHSDFFLAANGHTTPVAVVSGKMLGDIDAKYSGSIELTNRITIPANGVAQVKNSIGLTSGVSATDETKTEPARNKATTFITGNYSWDHGGGIMSNGDLYLGQPADTYVYPSLKLKATKELDGRTLEDGEFEFTVYRKDSDTAKAPSWDNNGNFSHGGCGFVKSAKNTAGNIAFDLSEKLSEQLHDSKQLREQLLTNGTGEITYYLVENAGNLPGVIYDRAVYEIKVTVKYNKTVLMSVPIQGNSSATRELNVHNFTIDRVDVTKNPGGSASSPRTASADANGYYSIVDSSSATSTNKATFTNTYDPEVSWTPMATKVVEGGEMKEFTLQLAKDSHFKDEDIIGTAVTSDNDKKQTKQTLSFRDKRNETIELKYKLSDIRNNPDDPCGPFKTFTYYVREKTDGLQFSHYTYDHSVYKFTVEPTYETKKGEINCKVTYMKGTVNSEGNWTPEDNAKERTFIDTSAPNSTDTSIPTFTNTYSTSLPLSGMSGVTLTYLAGAAVLCAAAAWMHIRRKANAKGGKRRE